MISTSSRVRSRHKRAIYAGGHGIRRPQRRPGRRASGPGGSATTTPCSAWSPAPTSPAGSTRATRRHPATAARRPRGRGSGSAPRSATATWPGSARRFIDVTPDDLRADVIYQIGALQALAHVAGSSVTYVQTSWRAVQHDRQQPRTRPARSRTPCMPSTPRLPVLGLAGSVFFSEADRLGFAPCPKRSPIARIGPTDSWSRDGSATPCCTTRSRSPTGWRRWCSRDASSRSTGQPSPITVESVCVHGDSPGAVQIATAVRDRLVGDGVQLAAFV